MQYITYEEYQKIGGACDLAAFTRNIDRACGIIDNATHKRIEKMATVPSQAKALCRDLVEYLVNNQSVQGAVASWSQNAGGVSESESYVVKSKDEQAKEIDNLICDYLLYVNDDNGTPLLYRGCSV